MPQHILIDANNNVINNIEWDGKTPWEPPEGYRVVLYEGPVWHGAKWDGATVTAPEPHPGPKPRPESGNVHVIGE